MHKIKICGITQERELDKLIELKVDYAGLVVFFPKSRRNNDIGQAAKLINYVKEKKDSGSKEILLKTVAVMVSPDIGQISAAEEAGFDILQIHGELYEEVRKRSRLPIWRAFNLSSYENSSSLSIGLKKMVSDNKISGIVFDGAKYGGGEAFKWDVLKNIDINIRDKLFILAGGLTSENVAKAVETLNPDILDVSSGVEYDDKTIPGKDLEKTERFVRAVRDCMRR